MGTVTVIINDVRLAVSFDVAETLKRLAICDSPLIRDICRGIIDEEPDFSRSHKGEVSINYIRGKEGDSFTLSHKLVRKQVVIPS